MLLVFPFFPACEVTILRKNPSACADFVCDNGTHTQKHSLTHTHTSLSSLSLSLTHTHTHTHTYTNKQNTYAHTHTYELRCHMCAHAHKTQSKTCTLHVTKKLTHTVTTFTSVQFSLFSLVLSSKKNCDKTKPSKSYQTRSETCTRHASHKLTSTCKTIILRAQMCTKHYVRSHVISLCQVTCMSQHYVRHIHVSGHMYVTTLCHTHTCVRSHVCHNIMSDHMCTNMHQTILCSYKMSTYVRTRQNATRAHSFTHSRAQKHTYTAAHEHTHTHMKYDIICAQMRTRQDRQQHMRTPQDRQRH